MPTPGKYQCTAQVTPAANAWCYICLRGSPCCNGVVAQYLPGGSGCTPPVGGGLGPACASAAAAWMIPQAPCPYQAGTALGSTSTPPASGHVYWDGATILNIAASVLTSLPAVGDVITVHDVTTGCTLVVLVDTATVVMTTYELTVTIISGTCTIADADVLTVSDAAGACVLLYAPWYEAAQWATTDVTHPCGSPTPPAALPCTLAA